MSSAATEQITLDSGEISIRPTEKHLNTITLELLQINKSKKLQKLFRVYDDKILAITEKNRKKTSTWLINLIMLDESPKRKRGINMAYFFTGIGFGAAAFITSYLKTHGVAFLSSPYTYAAIGSLALIAVFLFGLMIKDFQNSLIFTTRHGRVPVVEFFHNNPDKTQYQGVISQLMEKIAAVQARYPIPDTKLLPAELGEHRRLRDEGLISTEQYNMAKARILGRHAS
jgi:hypothetical protein